MRVAGLVSRHMRVAGPVSKQLQVTIATGTQMAYWLPANSLMGRGYEVTLVSSSPKSRLKGFREGLQTRFVPAPVKLFYFATHIEMPQAFHDSDGAFFDRLVSLVLPESELTIGAASSCLLTGRTAKRRGGRFVLDRACPDIRVQQAVIGEESRKLGGTFDGHALWFIERQVEEYEEADVILCPSDYSRRSFPDELRQKVVLAPLLGRASAAAGSAERVAREPGAPFTVGVVGGDPVRKGYRYLLEAWKKLALPNARLLIRSGGGLKEFPVLERLLAELPNVSIVGYVPNIADFYRRCDAFVLPSIDDGFGMAMFEAIANGVATIATRNCGAAELLTDGEDCLIVDAFSAEQLGDALLNLYGSPELRERLAITGQASVARLRMGDVCPRYEQGMDEMLARVGLAPVAAGA